MTIKTQAFLQGYLHEKTAEDDGDPGSDQRPVTPIVAAPGIPQTEGGDRHIWAGVKTLFPDGKARFKRTQQRMPDTTFDDQGRETMTPASVNDQLLRNVPGGAAALVAEQRRNFENDRPSFLSGLRHGRLDLGRLNLGSLQVPAIDRWTKPKVGPRRDLIDFDKRNQPVSLDSEDKSYGGPVTHRFERRIAGIDLEELRKHPEGEWVPLSRRGGKEYREYHGFPETSDGRSAGYYDDDMAVLGHEGTHNYTGGLDLGHVIRTASEEEGLDEYIQDMSPGTSYITDKGMEYTQAVTAGLNAMRDVTGEKLNDPQQVHQLFDEIIAKPSILNSIASEHARVFRTYLYLRKTNPKAAKQLRNSMAFNSKYLVKNEPAGDPMVKTAVERL